MERNGRWVGRYLEDVFLADGTRRRVHRRVDLGDRALLPTAKLARRALDQLLAPINNNSYQPRSLLTFAQFVEKWRATSPEAHFAPATTAAYNASLNHHWLPAFGNRQMNDITTEVLQNYINHMSLNPGSLRTRLSHLKAIWRAAEAWGYVTHSPFARLRLPHRLVQEARFFTPGDVQRILDAAVEPEKTLYWLLAQTGLRIGEALALQWADFDGTTLTVRRNLWRKVLRTPKTAAGYRRVAVSPQLSAHLRAVSGAGDAFIFADHTGSLRHAETLRERLQSLLTRLGIPKAGFHAFRHTSASVLDSLNAPMKLRQQRLGHSSAAMTLDVYTHNRSEGREVAAEYDKFFALDCSRDAEVLANKAG